VKNEPTLMSMYGVLRGLMPEHVSHMEAPKTKELSIVLTLPWPESEG
jgi:hypothetical protein